MIIKHLELNNFKNYKKSKFSFSDSINIIRGDNAQGKTNLLESIFFLSCVKSLHAKRERDLIYFGENCTEIHANTISNGRNIKIDVLLSTSSKRKISVNDIRQLRMVDYIGTLQSILFVPDDLTMIKDGPANRRRFLNIAISQLKPNYIHYLSNYNRTLEQKNKLLKSADFNMQTDALLDVYNERLSNLAAYIMLYRGNFVEELSKIAQQIHYEMSIEHEKLHIVYEFDNYVNTLSQSREDIASDIYKHLCMRKKAEQANRSCLIGPHRDDLNILIDEKSAKNFASQGQIRTAVLALKLAERDVFFNASGEYPVLLFDDVLSELDTSRQNYIINKIRNGQVFITSCDNTISSSIAYGKVFSIHGGKLQDEFTI